MKELGMLGFLAIIVFQVFLWKGERNGATRPNDWAQASASQARGNSPQRMRRPVPQGETAALVAQVAKDFGVPAGLLYGVWQVESHGLEGGYGSKWQSASAMVRNGRGCGTLTKESCEARFNELRAICAQERNGAPICDPFEVRTSVAMALGPMQIMPFNVLGIRRDGTVVWSAYAVDYDGDGVVDPHSLPDALATAAKILKHRFGVAKGRDVFARWQWATNAYYGSQMGGYYGNVRPHWDQWCETRGCGGSTQRVASR